MGLDMYLIKKKKESTVPVSAMEYTEWTNNQLAYWRKANQIHKWFVDNVQGGVDDCKYYQVKKENIEELRNICNTILEKAIIKKGKVKSGDRLTENGWEPIYEDGEVIINKELCEELLPTVDGFFFGSQEYNNYYLEDIEKTVDILSDVLKTVDFENEEVYYTSSW